MNREQALATVKRLRERVVAEPERRTEHLVAMADAYLAAGFFDAASMVCRAVLKLEPLNVAALLRLGRALLGRDDAAGAHRLYSALTGSVPACAEGWWGLWGACRRLGHRRQAAEALLNLLAENDADGQARLRAAEDFEAAALPGRAAELLDEAADADATPLLVRRGLLHAAAGRASRGLTLLERAIERGGVEPEVILSAAETAAAMTDWRAVARFAAARLEAGPVSLRALELLGRARMELDEHDGAILALERLTERAPDVLEYRVLLAEALFRADELADAEREIGRCLARDPERSSLVLRLAEIAWRRSERQKAEDLYERTLALDPGATLALYRLGVLKFERHLYPAALTCFRRLMVAQPDNVKAHLYLGRTLRMTGSFERSRNHLERARELAPRSAEAELELGLLDLELHRISLSREHLERARALDPDGETGKRASYELTHLGEHEVVRRRAVGETPRSPRPPTTPREQRWIKLC